MVSVGSVSSRTFSFWPSACSMCAHWLAEHPCPHNGTCATWPSSRWTWTNTAAACAVCRPQCWAAVLKSVSTTQSPGSITWSLHFKLILSFKLILEMCFLFLLLWCRNESQNIIHPKMRNKIKGVSSMQLKALWVHFTCGTIKMKDWEFNKDFSLKCKD